MKNIFKVIIIASLALLAGSKLAAQEKKLHFGVTAGLNFQTLNSNDYKNNLGYKAGVAVRADLPAWFSIQPELLFHVKSGKLNKDTMLGFGYLELPVNVQWGPWFDEDKRFRAFIQAAPYLGYAISKDKSLDLDWQDINRFEYGAGIGLGFTAMVFNISAMYNWNFGSIAKYNASESFSKKFSDKNFSGFTLNISIMF